MSDAQEKLDQAKALLLNEDVAGAYSKYLIAANLAQLEGDLSLLVTALTCALDAQSLFGNTRESALGSQTEIRFENPEVLRKRILDAEYQLASQDGCIMSQCPSEFMHPALEHGGDSFGY